MGTNRRYAESIAREADDRYRRQVMTTGEPESLTDSELALDVEPLTRAPQPRPVRAWVRYAGTPIRVDGEAVAWTEHAVAVRWDAPEGQHRAWVWAGAVEAK